MELIGDMADADGAVVCGALRVPIGDKAAWANLEAISAVGVADFENRTGDRLGLGDDEFKAAIGCLDDGEQGDGSMADTHLDGEAPADFAVIDMEGADFGFALGDGDVSGTIMAHEAEAVMEQDIGNAGGIDPGVNLLVDDRVVLEHACDLVELDTGATEDVGDFRDGAGGAIGEPFTRHAGAVAHAVEGGVVARGGGLQVEDDDGNAGALDHGQDR